MSITVFLADDHRMVREGFRLLLETQSDIKVVGEAGNGREAVRQAIKLAPDIILMDIAMPELNGIEATKQIIEARSIGKDYNSVNVFNHATYIPGFESRGERLHSQGVGR